MVAQQSASATAHINAPSSPATWRLVLRAGWRAVRAFGRLHLSLIAAGIAFYGMLALFPALASLVAVWSLFADPEVVGAQIEMAETFVPDQAYALIEQQVRALLSTDSTTLGWASAVSLGTALWSTRLGIAALMDGMNIAYRQQGRSTVGRILAAFAITLVLMAVAVAALAAVVIAPVVLAFLPLGPSEAAILSVLRWVIALALVVGALGVVLRLGPNRARAGTRWLSAGVVLAVAIWAAVSWAFSFYLSNFGNYNEIYGTLGAVVALLMWLWLSAIAVLAGALLNAEIEGLRAEIHAEAGSDFMPDGAPPPAREDASAD